MTSIWLAFLVFVFLGGPAFAAFFTSATRYNSTRPQVSVVILCWSLLIYVWACQAGSVLRGEENALGWLWAGTGLCVVLYGGLAVWFHRAALRREARAVTGQPSPTVAA